MNKALIKTLVHALTNFISDNSHERENMVDWAAAYMEDVEIYTGKAHDCVRCEERPAAVILDQQHSETSPERICRRCLLEDVYDFLDGLRTTPRP